MNISISCSLHFGKCRWLLNVRMEEPLQKNVYVVAFLVWHLKIKRHIILY